MHLSTDQEKALDSLLDWFYCAKQNQFITLGGYAGTGKTTLISIFRKKINKTNKKIKVAFCSFTGKAARVLKIRLKQLDSIYKQDFIGTIHSLIYSPIINKKEEIVGWELQDKVNADLIIVDESSMINQIIWKDLLSFKIPVIAVGDHGQLPPINGQFNLMKKPHLILEQIHRQSANNPIIHLSILARNEGRIPIGNYSEKVKKIYKSSYDTQEKIQDLLNTYSNDTYVLCGYNYTRIKLNNFIRSSLGFDNPKPEVNDRVICLRNNRITKLYNGMLGSILSIEENDEDWYYAEILLDDESKTFKGIISSKQFNNPEPLNFTDKRSRIKDGDLFDFGYALTVHKSQGGQAKRVILFEERFAKMDEDMWRRWLYTAVTRAEEELYIVGN